MNVADLWQSRLERRLRNARLARLAIIAISVFIPVALFYAATN